MRQFVAVIALLVMFALTMIAQPKQGESVIFTPISHASFVIQAPAGMICVDPVGDAKAYGITVPAIILITDIHGDHLSPETVASLKKGNTSVIGPKAVVDKLGYGTIMNNGEKATFGKVTIEAIPMYNLTAERMKFHEKGRGNGYVVTVDGKRIYISGDTEDIPEMRGLKTIDYAFVCMNLPYTMTPEQAASAVLEFKPKVVFPYHYRGTGGFSDVEAFKKLVSANKSIEVRMLKWYE
ncbi:MAG TPA: MBL fold metallo-hydrolase [Bacteroidota bacterium]|nr:MBL fold metallo-hydrolase [Bacteroidota bacterium]